MYLGNSYPNEIKKYLDDEAQKFVDNHYDSVFLSAAEKNKLIQKQTLSTRAILGWLRRLTKQGLVIHEDNKYRLSSQVASDVDFMAALFGLNVLVSALPNPNDNKDFDERLFELVNYFGVSMVYILMYCLQPLMNNNYDKTELEDYRQRWATTAISPEHMLTFLREQLGLVKTISKSNNKMEFKELSKVQYEKIICSLETKYPEMLNRINQGVEELHKMIKSGTSKT